MQQEAGFTLTASLTCNGINRNLIGVNSQAAGVTAHNNTITENTTHGADGSAISSGSMNFQSNWWGCAAGPGSVNCDTVTTHVDSTSNLTDLPVCSPLCGIDADCINDTCSESNCSSGTCSGPAATLCGRPPCSGSAPFVFTTGTPATSGHKLTTTVTSPTCGDVVITESSSAPSPPAGFSYIQDQSKITTVISPPLTASTPLTVVLQLFSTEIPANYSPLAVQLFTNGTLVPYCTAPSTNAVPNPCIAKEIVLANGNLEITALTSSGANFNLGVWSSTSADLGLPIPPVGLPGGVACLTGSLASRDHLVIAAADNIGFDPAIFSVGSCSIFPTLTSSYGKSLSSGPLGSGVEQVAVSGSSNIMPDGLMYTCEVTIASGTTLGRYALSNSASATDQLSQPINTFGGTTQVLVTSCVGDCNGNGVVTIGEVVKAVNLFQGLPLCSVTDPTLSCPAADANHSHSVSIGEVVQTVNRFQGGC